MGNAALSPQPPLGELDVTANTRPTSPELPAWTVPRHPKGITDSRLTQAGIHITSPGDAISATLALRILLASKNLKEHPLRIALQTLNIHYKPYIKDTYRAVKAIIQTLEQCFKSVAELPRVHADPIPKLNGAP